MKKETGITLVALVVTIIVLIILAGVSISLVLGDNGIVIKSKQAKQNYSNAAIKENEIMREYEKQIEEIDNLQEKSMGSTKALRLTGNNYIEAAITQEELFANDSYTIALQVRLNQGEQKSINLMGIIGDHTGSTGLALQFSNNKELSLIINGSEIYTNYDSYFNKWTDIVIVCKNGKTQLYLDKELKIEKELVAIPENSKKILIGTSVSTQNRAMIGSIYSVKIWKEALNKEEIEALNMTESTTIKSNSIVLEGFLGEEEQRQEVGQLKNEKYRTIIRKEDYPNILKLNGGTYLNTEIATQELLSKSNYTIAIRVKINQEEQKRVNLMGILGDHTGSTGLALQFSNNKELSLLINGSQNYINYDNYFDKWTDIVIVRNNDIVKLYVNKEEKLEVNNVAKPVENKNILIGTSVSQENRAIIGSIATAKIWNITLSEQQIKELDMKKENTEIERDAILREYLLEEELGNLTGSNYTIVEDYES